MQQACQACCMPLRRAVTRYRGLLQACREAARESQLLEEFRQPVCVQPGAGVGRVMGHAPDGHAAPC